MIKKYTAILVLLFICQAGYSQKSMDQIFREFSKTKGVTNVNIGKFTLTLASMFTETMGVNGIEVFDFSECSSEIREQFSLAVKELKDTKYETMINSNEDGERTKIMVQIKDDMIRELVVLTTGNSSAMVRIKGKIKPSDIEKVIKDNGR